MIQISDLNFGFDATHSIFKNLALTVDTGEKVAVVGPSGCGKTTLIRLLAGLFPVHSGKICFNGEVFHGGDRSNYRNQHIGIVFQDYNLLNDLTVAENMTLRLAIAGLDKDDEACRALLQRVGLADFEHTRVGLLSGGQQQRVAAVRALITQPHTILADEPTGNLDDESARLVIDLLLDSGPRTTVLVATHDNRVLDRFTRHVPFASLESDA